jgi:hypothetical protein
MLENIDKTINTLCECIQNVAAKNVANGETAELTKALATLLVARANASTTFLQ